ncbi:MAG: hypothetical protein IIA35_06585, partial [Proteobacteria bacterium]|nr:hypothetical protein [Pseudomonadota bacterium]
MRVPKPVFLVKRFAAAVLIVAATLVAATAAPAAEGPALAPAEYKPLPVGTKVRYDTWAFTVTRSEDLEVAVKTDKRKWVVTYGLFGKQGSNIYT